MKSTKPLGVVLYEGASQLDRKPIVVVATFASANGKTGNMIQTWILLQNLDPVNAVKTGEDSTVCGDCRFAAGRGCYVNVGQAPLAVWAGFHRGIYPVYDPIRHAELFAGRRIRLGSYGDPAAVPVEFFHRVLARCSGHTGYTHQWKKHPEYRGILQASCDSPQDFAAATSSGWKCFTVLAGYQTPLVVGTTTRTDFGVVCLAETHLKTCEKCKLCSGSRAHVVIAAHGAKIGKAKLSLAMA